MRKWTIRNKMIAGLTMLALVIGVLVYSSWSQLVRDRELAAEIGELAEDIDYAHELTRLADSLKQYHDRFEKISESDHQMIRSDAVLDLEKLDESDIEVVGARIDVYLPRLMRHLKQYLVDSRAESAVNRPSNLLVDPALQRARIEEIADLVREIQTDWENTSKLDHAVLRVANHHQRMGRKLTRLVELTHTHDRSIKDRMKEFSASVHTGHRAKRHRFYAYTSLSAFLIVFLAWQFWTLIVSPFRTLFRGAELIASGHHKHKIILGTNDEIGLMAETVNDITDRFNQAMDDVTKAKSRAEREVRERTREVIQNEQLASVGFLAAGVAHEINNPLGAIAWSAETLEETLDELPEEELERYDQEFVQELKSNLGLIQSEAYRCKGITKRLLHFSRLSDSTRAEENLSDLVERVVSMVSKVGEYRCKTINTHLDERVSAYCNAQEIQQVVLNLISNALESVDTDGQVDVYVRRDRESHDGMEHAVVIVKDDGCGMSQEVMEHLFEPFFTRRRDNTGTGLGLSISARIVSLHHGSLTPHSDGDGCGSTLTLRLPTEPARSETPLTLLDPANEITGGPSPSLHAAESGSQTYGGMDQGSPSQHTISKERSDVEKVA
jgi:signal transduction histidine kinase